MAIIGLWEAFVPTPVTAQPASEKGTMIHVVVVEAHDRVTPTPIRGIVVRHETNVFIRSGKQIEEHTENFNNAGRNGPIREPDNDISTSLGNNGKRTVWHVLGTTKLQRLSQSPTGELLTIWTIEVLSNNQCSIDVKYILEQGKTVSAGKIMGVYQDATFTNFKVLQATCNISDQ